MTVALITDAHGSTRAVSRRRAQERPVLLIQTLPRGKTARIPIAVLTDAKHSGGMSPGHC